MTRCYETIKGIKEDIKGRPENIKKNYWIKIDLKAKNISNIVANSPLDTVISKKTARNMIKKLDTSTINRK